MTAKKPSGIYAYLEANNLLRSGSDNAIKEAKAAYWKVYRAAWRKRQRQELKEYTVSLNAHEKATLSKAGKQHGMSTTKFIKVAAIAYAMQKYVVADTYTGGRIIQLLSLNYTGIQSLLEEDGRRHSDVVTALQKMDFLISEVTTLLYRPKLLCEAITEEIRNNRDFKTWILELLKREQWC